MKTRKISIYVIVLALGVLLMQCTKEGPMGPAGADGTDGTNGVDGNVTCLVCHSSAAKLDIEMQFNQSVHKAGAIAVDYAGARSSCAECHSSEGFIEFAATGDVAENISAPSAWECKTCHSLHETMEASDYALRLDDAVTFASGGTFDYGNNNLCANCHMTRRTGPYDMDGEYVDLNGVDDDGPGGVGDHNEHLMGADEFFISSTHYGPHHGPQANLVEGEGFAEIAGTATYPGVGTNFHIGANCMTCHMGTYSDGAGGHTYNPQVTECDGCHAVADGMDHGGFQTATQAKIDALEVLLFNAGIVDVDGHPIVGIYSVIEAQAFYNWIGIAEDRSMGAHNPNYIDALLDNTIDAMTP